MRRATAGRSVVRRVGVLMTLTATLLALAGPAAATASTNIESFTALTSNPEAGAHPNLLTAFWLSSHQTAPVPCACDDARNVTAHLPPGLIGNPRAVPQCTVALFAANECPVDSQLGVAWVGVAAALASHGYQNQDFLAPVYNLVPPPNVPALLAFKSAYLDTPTFEDVSARTAGDYGVDVTAFDIEHIAPLTGFEQLTWGVPASPANDNLRFAFGQTGINFLSLGKGGSPSPLCNAAAEPTPDNPTEILPTTPAEITRACYAGAGTLYPAVGEYPPGQHPTEGGPGHPISSPSPEIPFLQNPTTCGLSSLSTNLEVLSYDTGITEATSPWPATTDCAQLSFNPSQSIEPTTHAADSPSGAEFRLTVPQFESPSVPSPSELRAAHVTFPKGFSLAPNVTNGKTTCSEAEAKMGPYASTEEGHCPEDAKIGTLSVDTPVLPGPLNGAAYLGEPKSGNRFRMFLLFDGFGVHVKLPGTITPDPATGQIQIDFQNLPQAPFESFNLHVFGSERGPLDTPTQCGKYEVTSEWTPWDASLSNQTSRQFFTIDEGPGGSPCPNGARPFAPRFAAASTSNTAGAHTDFWLDLKRSDGEQNPAALTLTTPPGFAATLRGSAYCPESAIAAAALSSHLGAAEQASPSCPASSLVGETVAAAGPGTHPLYLPGKVYLAGPYKGAPLSFLFITPAVSAGYDLGNVVIRAAIHVNPETAQVTTASDPLPQIFGGIPLRLREIYVDLNRPDFALNPTNCDPFAIAAQISGDEGALSTAKEHFQVANCASLPFKPTLSIGFTGSTRHAGNPGVKATLDYPSGGPYANIAKTSVTLPPTELIDNAHINDPCTRAVFNQGHDPGEKCPPGSILGFAKAETPLLDKPLEGPVYLRSAPENKNGLPDLVAALNGQIDIDLDGKIATVQGNRLRTTFATVPDAPVSRFALTLDAGHKSLLETSAKSLCAHPLHVSVDITGQNGKTANQNPVLTTPCGKKHKRKGRVHHDRGAGR